MLHRSWALLLLLSATFAFAGQLAPKPQESYAPYWTSDPGWTTELQLKNNLLKASLTVTPVLRIASGKEIALDPTTIPPNALVSVWVNEGLLAHASDLLSQPGSYGSVVFRYTSPSAGNLYANVVLSIHGEPISFPIVARPSWSIPGRMPSSLEGIWWQPRAGLNDVLVLNNTAESKISGALILSDSSGKQSTQTLTLGPRQTQRFSTSDLISKAGLNGSYGGISFALQSASDAIDAVHFVYDEVSKFSTSLELSSRYPQMSLQERAGPEAKHWTMRAPMLALQNPDPSLGLPRGIALQPTLFIRNTTAKNITADLSLTWRGDSGKGQVNLPQLQLAPFATQQVQIGSTLLQIPNKIPQNAHWGMVTLTTDALPDDLVAIATSIDPSGRYNLATRFAGGIGGHFTGGEWDLDANHNAIAAITNIGSKPTNALLTLHYDKGTKKYELQQTIQPGDQMWVNLAQLVRNRVADRNGNTLPADVSSVTYDVKDLTPGGYSLMVNPLATNSTYGFGAGKLNANCCSYNDPTWIPDAFTFDGAGGDDPADIGATDSCDGDVYNESIDFTTWSSDNTAVAVVTTQNVRAAGDGSATGTAVGHLMMGVGSYCAYQQTSATVPITVEQPYDLQVNSDIQETVNCGSNPSTRVRQITYNVLNTNGTRMKIPFQLRENVPTNIVSSCNQQVVQTGATCTSNILYQPELMGEFTDFLSPGCPSSPGDSPCGFQFANQQWQWCQPSGAQTSIGTIGPDNVENTLINVDGNLLGFGYGKIFLP